MSNYYDPWGHVFRIVLNRLLLFVFLSIVASAGLWWWLLKHFCESSWQVIVSSAWALLTGDGELRWRLVFWLTVACATLATSTLFALLMRTPRLRRGDRHRRGARVVVDADHNDE